MATLGVLFGGLSPEHDISIITGLQAAHLLGQRGHDVAPLYWTRSGAWERVPPGLEAPDFAEGRVAGATPLTLVVPEGFVERRRLGREAPLALEAVVNCCHGGPGEDGTITALLLLCGIPVSGPQPEGAAWAMDKLATAGMVAAAGLERFGIESIPTAVLAADTTAIDLPTPWVVKPRFGGSSLGVHTDVADLETAKALAGRGPASAGAVVQPQLTGWADLNIAVRTHPALQVSAIERPNTGGGAYSYQQKYLRGGGGMESAQKEVPAVIPPGVQQRIEDAARALVLAVGLHGGPRVDFLYDGGERLALCEINTIPGSLGLYLWNAIGVDRATVVADLAAEARLLGTNRPHWSATTDGAALRASSSVAAKLS